MKRFGHPILSIATLCAATIALSACMRTSVRDDVLDFDLTDLDGNRVSLSDDRFEGKVVLVELGGMWCPPCLDLIPHLISWQDTYRDRGFEIVSLDFAAYGSESMEKYSEGMRGYLEERGVNYTVIQAGVTTDLDDVLPALDNFVGFPTSIFIGRDGSVEHVKYGFREAEVPYYKKTIEEMLDEGVVSTSAAEE